MATLEELEARVQALETKTAEHEEWFNDDYHSITSINQTLSTLQTKVDKIKSCTCDPSKYASAEDFAVMQKNMQVLEDAVGGLVNAPEYKLPMTAAELVAKLNSI